MDILVEHMDRRLSRFLHRTERAINGHLVPRWRRHRIGQEEILGRVLRQLNVDCVFDVGANRGGYGRMLRDYCDYSGRIISFEPAPDVFAELRAVACDDPLWETHDFALGRSEETMKFQVHHARNGSSFLPVVEEDARSSGNRVVQEIDVPVRTLNKVFPALREKFQFARPFLKMDTQGFDLEVFSGALDVVDSFVGLQSELSVQPFYEGAPLFRDSLKIYEQAGFVLTGFVPSNTDAGLRLREVDCIMARL